MFYPFVNYIKQVTKLFFYNIPKLFYRNQLMKTDQSLGVVLDKELIEIFEIYKQNTVYKNASHNQIYKIIKTQLSEYNLNSNQIVNCILRNNLIEVDDPKTRCTFKLTATDHNAVYLWYNAVQTYAAKSLKIKYTRKAFDYFTQCFYHKVHHKKNYDQVSKCLDFIFNCKSK